MLGNTAVLGGNTLVKINQDGYSSEYLYKGSTEEYTLRIRHQKTKGTAAAASKDRHNVELTIKTYATAEAAESSKKVYIVIEQLPSDTSLWAVSSLLTYLTASTNAVLTSVMAWES